MNKSIQKPLFIAAGTLLLLLLVCVYIYTHYAREDFRYSIRHVPQNANAWLDKKTKDIPLVTPENQKKFAANYLQRYFSPWAPNYLHYFPVLTTPISNLQQLKESEQGKINHYLAKPGYGINHLSNSKEWIQSVADTMDLAHFPNANTRVMTITNVSMRDLPTSQAVFGDWHAAGEGYPFDYLQATTVAANTPALVIQKTRNGAWSLIITNRSFGWVPSYSLATVNDQFIRQWQTGNYVTLTKNGIPLTDNQGNVRFTVDIGKIFPRIPQQNEKNSSDNYTVLIAVADPDQRAVILTSPLSTQIATPWPIVATPQNIAAMMNEMLKVKYGWGGMTGDCDCSFTTMDLFSTFGIWLPRNSSEQAVAGRGIDLSHLSTKEKEKTIMAQGIPFLTLLHMPGHITVYIGKKHNRLYLFQTVWGVHTRLLGQDGRAILGSTVITPIDLGKNDWNVADTFIDRIDRMILLNEPTS